MTNPTPTQTPSKQTNENSQTLPSPLRCLTGAVISGGIGYAAYLLTISIAQTFANKPIHSDNVTALNIAAAIRTLVLGISSLATAVFGIAALGLFALAIQVLIQQSKSTES